ncbi:family 1 encapsulin nanocompartment shell protein [Pseudonocardia eucalypti]|uniref:Type 1 encapsulin shell protein n=1 Tax=Pseudonocardia eucalypti TaxID=648755 RepID=A0ABP9QM89_9PSEU|nr:putative linocin/CFP29 family protein [Pseudonocardia eucalypti]
MANPSNHLLREQAPLAPAAWRQVDDEARERLTPRLAARRLVDFAGPSDWDHSAINLGRSEPLDGPPPGCGKGSVRARLRRVQPLAEIRVPFTVDRAELEDAERGAVDLDFDELDAAARLAAEIENRAIFHGWPDARIDGLIGTTPSAPALGDDPASYSEAVANAVATLRVAGVEGPYALAADPGIYTRIAQSTERGYLLIDHLERILGGKVVWTPGLEGAAVLSQRGGDFLFEVGQDLAVGYSHHSADTVSLYLEQTFTFRVAEPDAAITLTD